VVTRHRYLNEERGGTEIAQPMADHGWSRQVQIGILTCIRIIVLSQVFVRHAIAHRPLWSSLVFFLTRWFTKSRSSRRQLYVTLLFFSLRRTRKSPFTICLFVRS